MRVYALYIVVAFLVVYAWKDWFKSLCGLIVLMAVLEHPDMPRGILGIQGLNMWNVLMIGILPAWLIDRRRKDVRWDMPRHMNVLLGLYIGVMLIGFLRAVFDLERLDMAVSGFINEDLFNRLKWIVPAILVFDGCRTRKHAIMVVCCVLALYCLLAVQVARATSPRVLTDLQYMEVTRGKLDRRIGYHPSDLSTILAGASWGLVVMMFAARRVWCKLLILAAIVGCSYSQALTGGRAGFLALGGVGLCVCAIRYRKTLLLLPIVLFVLSWAFPASVDRMLLGFGETNVAGEMVTEQTLVTSGRTDFWPYVLDEIENAPLIGHGTCGMVRSGLTDSIGARGLDRVTWPHSAYLEWLLDHGVLGLVPVLLFYAMLVFYSARLLRSSTEFWTTAIGGLALSSILAQLIAGIGSQHFYPLEGNFAMWVSIFLMMRIHVDRKHAMAGRSKFLDVRSSRQYANRRLT